MKRKSWKRTAAFVTSLAMTTTMLPSDLSGIVTSIVHAASTSYENVNEGKKFTAGDTITFNQDFNNEYYINGTKIVGDTYEITDNCVVYDLTIDESGNKKIYRFTLGMAAGSELTSLITAEPGETWTVTVLPGTVKDGTNGTNAESRTYTEVTIITEDGIFNSNEVNAQAVATFRDNKDNTNTTPGLGIYVASVDAAKKELTLTWEDPIASDCTVDFKTDENVWGKVTSIKNIVDGVEEENHIRLSSRVLDAKTGDVVTVKSKAALDFIRTNGEADVRYNETKIRNSETGELIEYVYTITVGRQDILVQLRDTNVSYANALYVDNDSVPEDLKIFKDTETTYFDASVRNADSDDWIFRADINPDAKYRIESRADNLSVFEESDDVPGFSSGDKKIDYKKSKDTPTSGEPIYTYEFTAPYENVYISRSAPHKHEFTWALSTDKKSLVATCKKNNDENSHTEDFKYTYSLGVKAPVNNVNDSYIGTFNADESEESNAALNEKYGFIKFRYATLEDASTNKWSKLKDDAPSATSYGKHKVVVDLYEDPNAYSPDEEGDQHFECIFDITPSSGDSDDLSAVPGVTIDFTEAAKAHTALVDEARYTEATNKYNGVYIYPNIDVIGLNSGDYALEGDVSATTKGVKTIVVVGKGVYEGLYKELDWYCPEDINDKQINLGANNITAEIKAVEYGSPLNFTVSGDSFDGNQDKVTYKAVSNQDKEIYNIWTDLSASNKTALRTALGDSFVEPTAPKIIDVSDDTVLNVLDQNPLYKSISALDNDKKAEVLSLLGIDSEAFDGFAVNYYNIIAEYEGEVLASGKIKVTPKVVTLKLENDRFTYNGKKVNFKITTDGIIVNDSAKLDSLKAISSLNQTNAVDAGPYVVKFAESDVKKVLGENYTVTNHVTQEETVDLYEFNAEILPLNLDGFATATASNDIFVENGKYQKPVIEVKDAEGNDLKGNYLLSGTISAKKAGTYTTRIEGTRNYTGTLKVDWKVLGADDFKAAIHLSEITATPMKLSDGRKVVKASFTRSTPEVKKDGYEVVDYGYIYANGDNANIDPSNLTLDKVDGTNIKKNSPTKPSASFDSTYEAKIVDKEDKGVTARGYVTLKHTATGATYTVYTHAISKTYDALTEEQLTEGFKLAYGDPLAAVMSSKNVVKVKFTREMAEESVENGVSVAEYGFIYTNCAEPTDAAAMTKYERMNLEDVDDSSVTTKIVKKSSKTVTDGSANNGTLIVPIVDNGNGVRYRAYVVLKNSDGATTTVYSDQKIKSSKVEEGRSIWDGYETDNAEFDNVDNVSSIQLADFEALQAEQANKLIRVENEKLNVVVDTNTYYAAKFQTTRFLGNSISAEDVTVLEYGFLYANEYGAPDDETKYVVDNAKSDTNKNSKIKKNTRTPKEGSVLTTEGSGYTLIVKFLDANNAAVVNAGAYNTIYTRGYVKIRDNNTGIESYVYSPLVTAERE